MTTDWKNPDMSKIKDSRNKLLETRDSLKTYAGKGTGNVLIDAMFSSLISICEESVKNLEILYGK